MVCIYCGAKTEVTNSRLQKRLNKVWRRRSCLTCTALFTSLERVQYETALAVRDATSHNIGPFERDKLFLSIYNACRHRPSAVSDATALTETIVGKLLADHGRGASPLKSAAIVKAVQATLKHFDEVALVQYNAFHPLTPTSN